MFPPTQEKKGKYLFSHQHQTIFSILQFFQASETFRNVFNTYTASVVISKENNIHCVRENTTQESEYNRR